MGVVYAASMQGAEAGSWAG